jgi:hypothetical protein
MRRADELGVSLAPRYHDEAVDTRAHRCTDGLVKPEFALSKGSPGAYHPLHNATNLRPVDNATSWRAILRMPPPFVRGGS